jgi:hypothetical protein
METFTRQVQPFQGGRALPLSAKRRSMKRKNHQKANDSKTINSAVLDKILGGVQAAEGTGKGAVIPQTPITSFFHS